MRHLFRTTTRYWAREVLLPLLLLASFVLYLVLVGQFLLGVLCGGFSLIFIRMGIRLWRYRLEMDSELIVWWAGRQEHQVLWSDVMTASISGTTEPSVDLFLGTKRGTTVINIQHLDHRAIWRLVQSYVNPRALEGDAYKETEDYKEWLASRERLVNEVTTPLRASPGWLVMVMGWPYAMILSLVAVWMWHAGEAKWVAIGFLVVAGVSTFIFLFTGPVEMDSEAVTLMTRWGHYRIRWDEVRRVEAGTDGSLVLYGDDKWLSLVPGLWASKGRRKIVELLLAQIQLRQIEVRRVRTSLKMFRNTRVR